MGTMTEAEFTEIVESTKRVVLSAIEKNLYPRFLHAIDDVVQETYLRAYKSLQKKQFEGRSALPTSLL
jgi:RNA polymerase sigma-70 factor (ECF subfamily)